MSATTPRTYVPRNVSVADIERLVGMGHAREGAPADSIAGVTPRLVVEPASTEEVSEVMKLASQAGLKVAARGGGTKLGWGNPPEALDLIVSTARLNRLIEHSAGDLVATVQAGINLDNLQAQLAKAGQMLALDPPGHACTMGGVIATDASGPLRLRYGTVRDLLIGITVVLADGTVAKSGGKVVKNVAGYDLGKLYTGSFGTLGIVVEATFRLHPLPEAVRTVVLNVRTPAQAGEFVGAIGRSSLVPSALELEWAHNAETAALYVGFEGIAPGVEAQAEATMQMAQTYGECHTVEADEAQDDIWRRLRELPWQHAEGVGLKLTCIPTAVPSLLHALLTDTGPDRCLYVRARAATGVILAVMAAGAPADFAARIEELRRVAGQHGGSLVVLHAPPELKRAVDVWGPVGDALPLMRRVKERFDPNRTLNPGRFVGGI